MVNQNYRPRMTLPITYPQSGYGIDGEGCRFGVDGKLSCQTKWSNDQQRASRDKFMNVHRVLYRGRVVGGGRIKGREIEVFVIREMYEGVCTVYATFWERKDLVPITTTPDKHQKGTVGSSRQPSTPEPYP